jgi:type I restriction enzyme S subunit
VSEWRESQLGALCSLIVDSEHKTAPKDPAGPHPLMRTSDLGAGRADFAGAQRVSAATHDAWTRRAVPTTGDLILAREAPVGGICRVPSHVHPVLGQRTVLLRPETSAVDSHFLMYRLAAPDLQGRMNEMATGATVPHLNMSDIRVLPVPRIPSPPTQRRIAAVLSAFDELIEINQRRIELLENLARSLYREWFVYLRVLGHGHGQPAGNAIPDGWEVRSVGQLAGSRRHGVTGGPFGSKLGRKDYTDSGVPVIRGTNLDVGGGFRDSGFVFVSESKADTLRSSIAKPGDIVVTQRGTLGQVGLIPASARHERYVLSQSQMKVTVDEAVGTTEYVYEALRSEETIDWIRNTAITAGVPHINLGMLRELKLVCPPIDLQKRFQDVVRPIWELADALHASSDRLGMTRDLLLPRLVVGDVDLSDVDLGQLHPADTA